MIGIPRSTLMMIRAAPESSRTPDTRISAQISPSAVETTSEPIVTRTGSFTPSSRMGRYSFSCSRKRSMRGVPPPGPRRSQAPLRHDLVDGAVGLQLGERGVDLLEQLAVGLAHPDADRADDRRLEGGDETKLGKIALLHIVGEDRIVGEPGLEAAGVDVAHAVRDGVVDLPVVEQPGLLQRLDIS